MYSWPCAIYVVMQKAHKHYFVTEKNPAVLVPQPGLQELASGED